MLVVIKLMVCHAPLENCIVLKNVFLYLLLFTPIMEDCGFSFLKGPAYEEFLKAASDDNEFQFVAVSDIEAAKILFPDIKPTNNFLGLVKDEEERYTTYGKSIYSLFYV